MSKILEVYTAKEMERKLGVSTQHICRLIKNENANIIENKDYHVNEDDIYLFADTALEKLINYRNEHERDKKSNCFCNYSFVFKNYV